MVPFESPKADPPTSGKPGDIESQDPAELAFSLRRAWYFLMHGLDQGPRVVGLQLHQSWLLGALSVGTRTMGDLARVTNTTQANTTGMVARLEKRGLVVRAQSAGDRRLVEVSLTDEGKAAVAESRAALADRVGLVTRDMTDGDRAELTCLLQKLVAPTFP